MKALWAFAVAGLVALTVEAHADTVYLKDGQSVWGREIAEEGDTVIVVRPGETLRFPKRDVDRIESWRLSVPKYYEPPSAGPGASDERPASTQPAAPSPMSAADRPAQPQAPAAATPPAAGAPTTATPPGQLTPTLLPPAPPPSADKPRY
ncbi:MAG: hypothetical protein H6Q85_896 [candidate division NC10 bacterium]|jgi:hypothetical protein|nr:hypothetical protein [candidate division NC10 bacterium]